MGRSKGLLLGVVLVAVALVAAGCGSQPNAASQAAQEQARPVEVVAVQPGVLEVHTSISGKVAARMEVNIVPKIGGKVARVNVQVGDTVKAGQVLVRLDTTEVEAQVRQAEAGLTVAEAQLAKVLAGTRPEQLAQARAALAMAEAGRTNAQNNLDTAQTNYERLQSLFEQGAVTKQQLEQAENGYKGAKVGLETAALQVEQARQALKMAETGATAEDRRVVEAQVSQARAAVDLARTQLANAVITAPVGGTVTAVNVDPGEMAGPGLPVAVLAQLDPIVVEAGVAEGDVVRLHQGQAVTVRVDALGGKEMDGKVASINPAADPRTRLYPLKVELPNPGAALKPGMSAAITAVVASRQDVLTLPADAVLTRGEEKVVYVVAEGKAIARKVTLGLDNGSRVAVTAGLAAGDQVVVKGQHDLEDGMAVQVPDGGNK